MLDCCRRCRRLLIDDKVSLELCGNAGKSPCITVKVMRSLLSDKSIILADLYDSESTATLI